jgi:hypothetical protein
MLKASFWHVDLGAAATRYNVMASGDLFHNGSRHHDCHHVPPRVDLGAAATRYNVMASGDLFHNGSMHTKKDGDRYL